MVTHVAVSFLSWARQILFSAVRPTDSVAVSLQLLGTLWHSFIRLGWEPLNQL